MAIFPIFLVFGTLILIPNVLAQSITLQGNWTSVGCYTDISTARTLKAFFTASDSMTVESCITTCTTAGFIYAGVEFGRECYCDSTIQIPSVLADLSNCNVACSGNSSEICGGPNRLSVLYSGMPGPETVQTVGNPEGGEGGWQYAGCFTDSTSARTLGVPVNIPSGVTAESCTAACQSLGGFLFAGTETGHECWCDNAINPPTQHVSDADCRMVCDVDHSQYCGNQDRVAVYRFTAAGSVPEGPGGCVSTDIGNFTLKAVDRNSLQDVVGLKAIVVEMVRGVVWGILSACTTCCSEWPTYSLQNSIFFPRSIVTPGTLISSTAPVDGESLTFVASSPPFPGFQAYCTMEDPTSPNNPPVLAFGGKADAFSLCTNTTANGRLDVVFSPVTGHPNYDLSGCRPVWIQVVT